MQKLLTEAEAAELLGVARESLARARRGHRCAPSCVRIGSAIRYRPEALESFLARQNSPAPKPLTEALRFSFSR